MGLARRAAVGLSAVVWACLPAGCVWGPRTLHAPDQSGQPGETPTTVSRRPERPARGVMLHTRLIEQPAGNDYLTRGLWQDTTDPLPHPLSALLAANGLRVGVVSGFIPAELERLARSEAAAVDPMLRSFAFGQPKPVPVNGPLPACTADAVANLNAPAARLELTAAECGLVVTVTPAAGDQLRVRCEPQIRHDAQRTWWKANAAGTGFDRLDQKPTEAFPGLAWEVTLSRRDVLVFGATADPDATLGEVYFFTPDQDRPRQRVLTLQVNSWEDDGTRTTVGTPATLAR